MFCIKYISGFTDKLHCEEQSIISFPINGHNSAKSKYSTSKIDILLGLLFFGAQVSLHVLGFKRLFLPDIQGLGSLNRRRGKNLLLKTHLLWRTHGLSTYETADSSSWGGKQTGWQGKQWALCSKCLLKPRFHRGVPACSAYWICVLFYTIRVFLLLSEDTAGVKG